ncbi:MAG: hypothetical protein CSA53_03190 [Gammaproteobacteria bacterium]|nr:MAG: hypothetical protein CSA53_03190 [Gammaproteobacteria bacterium]
MKYEISQTDVFRSWLKSLKDRQAVIKINAHLLRVENGNFGDAKSVGGGVYELRIFVGKGYRVYYTVRGSKLVLLLCGGHKGAQSKDIQVAKMLLKELEG